MAKKKSVKKAAKKISNDPIAKDFVKKEKGLIRSTVRKILGRIKKKI